MLKVKAKTKSIFLLLFIQFAALFVSAQIYDPVKWSFKVNELGGNRAELIFTAEIEENWHIYALDLPSDEGPLPTAFTIEPNENFETVGKIKGGKYITHFDPNFGMDLNYYENEAVFTQKIKKRTDAPFTIKGELSFMVCDDEKCLPPDYIPFEFKIQAGNMEDVKEIVEEDVPSDEILEESFEDLNTADPFGINNDVNSQIFEPVTWKSYSRSIGGDEYQLVFTAAIEEGWQLYAMGEGSDEGPIPLSFEFEDSKDYKFKEKLQQPKPMTKYDSIFSMDVTYFKDSVTLTRIVGLKKGVIPVVKGKISFMVCDDIRCIFPDPFEFEIDLNKAEVDTEYLETGESKTPWGIFIVAFLSGFAALFTPCVFPMIPLTVSFFTKQSKTRAKGIRNAIVYGISIIVIYTTLGMAITLAFGADAMNQFATNPIVNIFFFLVLIVFAISFLGAFEITLPNSWIAKSDKMADKGGFVGIFFMAFTLALVTFSCTGPIIGGLLAKAAEGGFMGPTMGMLGFSLAIAIPFVLFAAFPGWLNTMPKSGGWLNSVKVVLGFLELALAFKFLSNADLVWQLGLLQRETFLVIWIVIFALIGVYLLGGFKMSHDSDLKAVSVPRLFFAILAFFFTIYLIPGLWGAPLKIISGFPPPMFYSESPEGFGASSVINVSSDAEGNALSTSKNSSLHCPLGINCFHDYEEGLAYAKEVGKPVMLDFTGWACVNCRKMEEKVWSDPAVFEILNNEVVLISLYVDERKELPKEEQIEVSFGGKTRTLKTVGNKWSHFQVSRYKSNSQPQYILLDHNEEMLNRTASYDTDIQMYINWLRKGIDEFKKRRELSTNDDN